MCWGLLAHFRCLLSSRKLLFEPTIVPINLEARVVLGACGEAGYMKLNLTSFLNGTVIPDSQSRTLDRYKRSVSRNVRQVTSQPLPRSIASIVRLPPAQS